MNVDPSFERSLVDDMSIPKRVWLENFWGVARVECMCGHWVKVDEGECDRKNVYKETIGLSEQKYVCMCVYLPIAVTT